MSIKKPMSVPFFIGLAFSRAFIENYLIQLGLKNPQYADLFDCSIVGCYLQFKYKIILDVLFFVIYAFFIHQLYSLSIKKSIQFSFIFVVVFLFSNLYELIGSDISIIIPNYCFRVFRWSDSLFWSLEPFIGILIPILLVDFILLKTKPDYNPFKS